MTLYEMNQPLYAKLDTMTEQELKEKEMELATFLQETGSNYYMMLDPNGNYYTVYIGKNAAHMAAEIIDITKTLGDIKSIEVEGDRVEFWVLPPEEKKYKSDLHAPICTMFVLFDYTEGVVEVD